MNESFARIDRRICASAFLLALCAPTHDAQALVSAPYGSDGSPPDPTTQAEVQALDNALDGPKPGQSQKSWVTELKDAHDALYGSTQNSSSSSSANSSSSTIPGTSDVGVGGLPLKPPDDLCDTTLDDWVESSPSEPMSKALGDPAIVEEVETGLENFIYYMALIETSTTGGMMSVDVARPTVSGLQCTDDGSELTATIPVSLRELGVVVDHGSVVLHGSAAYRKRPEITEWCLELLSHDIKGFEPLTMALIKPALDEALSFDQYCNRAYMDPPWGTPTR